MDNKRNHELVGNARCLRREMTKEERHLWYDYLRYHPAKFRRQAGLGRFVVDFYCANAFAVIELDGSQHYDLERELYDKERTRVLESRGLRILRISNLEIDRNFKEVCEQIDVFVKSSLSQSFFE